MIDSVSGAPIDHVNISLAGVPGLETVTDGNGWFGILNVPPGSYNLRVARGGFKTMSAPATISTAGEIVTVDFGMTVPVRMSGFEAE